MLNQEVIKEIANTEGVNITQDDVDMFFESRCWIALQRTICKLMDEGQSYLEGRDAPIEFVKYGAGIIYACRNLLREEREHRKEAIRQSQKIVTDDRKVELAKNDQKLLDLFDRLGVE